METTAPTQVSSVCETYIEPSAIALYDYEPTAIDDLSFNVRDALHVFLRKNNNNNILLLLNLTTTLTLF